MKQFTIFQPVPASQTSFHKSRTAYFCVPKYYHDKQKQGFLKHFVFNDKIKSKEITGYSWILYIYKTNAVGTIKIRDSKLDWNFPDKY